jgi:hypothetical protein
LHSIPTIGFIDEVSSSLSFLNRYRCDPDCEPPRMLDFGADDALDTQQQRTMAKRGDVRKLNTDIGSSESPLSKL